MTQLIQHQYPNLSGIPTDYLPVVPNDDRDNTGLACIGLYATEAGNVRVEVERGNAQENDAFDASLPATIRGGSGSGAVVDAITVDAQGRLATLTWAAGSADYAAGDVLLLQQGDVAATYELVAADVSAGVLQDLSGKALQGTRTILERTARTIPIPAQTPLPGLFARVRATGTTAVDLFALQG